MLPPLACSPTYQQTERPHEAGWIGWGRVAWEWNREAVVQMGSGVLLVVYEAKRGARPSVSFSSTVLCQGHPRAITTTLRRAPVSAAYRRGVPSFPVKSWALLDTWEIPTFPADDAIDSLDGNVPLGVRPVPWI
jgi:hypothetical protein